MIARSCAVCGARVESGASRCPRHEGQAGRRATSCAVCGVRSRGTYCPDHDPNSEAERLRRQPWRAGYTDPRYIVNRKRRRKLAGGRCETCGDPVPDGEWETDHVVELGDGGTNDLDNLRHVCKPCHRRKTAEARRRRGR